MATDHQVALSRTHHRLPSTPSQHAAQQPRPVPAFLKKLYEMVNDPQNVALIRWSDSGDSFFVLDHERFAREVLGKWFKHQNFSSFVRQLNMYGFHKIPHLQQGVLRSGSETDFWNFGHANFHRGQADLLYLIHRKKGNSQQQIQMQQQMEEILDIHSIVQGISAIQRHQGAISSELRELKRSNEMLWQDALLAREKHQKQEDTINRIVKFLAGVFG
ncbi:hypothetical protein F5887DRAFT_826083, partial [Amanita rubescens]